MNSPVPRRPGFASTLFVLAAMALASHGLAADLPTLVWRNPTSQGGSLNDVIFANNLFVAVGQGGRVLTSSDSVTWHIAATVPELDIQGVAFGANQWVVVGGGGRIYTSPDTNNWTSRSSPTTQSLSSVRFAGDRFLACGAAGTILTSADGVTWTMPASGTTQPLASIAGRAGAYVTVGSGNTIRTSTDGVTWNGVTLAEPNANFATVAVLANQFVVVGNQGRVYTSPDGVAWTPRANTGTTGATYQGITYDGTQYVIGSLGGNLIPTANFTNRPLNVLPFNSGTPRNALTFGMGVIVAVGDGGDIATSTDGRTWTQRGTNGAMYRLSGIGFFNNRWFAVGEHGAAIGTILTSSDAQVWTRRSTGQLEELFAIAFGAGRYVAVGGAGYITTSTDGDSWTGNTTASGVARALNGIAFTSGRFVAVGNLGTIITSTDGLTWTPGSSGVTVNLNAVISFGAMFIAVGDGGIILTSPNGTTWTSRTSGTTSPLFGGVSHNGTAYVVGNGRSILASTNGQNWLRRALPGAPEFSPAIFTGIVPANGGLLVVGSGGLNLFSSDGNTWTYLPTTAFRSQLNAVASDGVTAVVVGDGGTILQTVDPAAPPSRLVNVATRGFVQPGGSLTPGFVLKGTGSKQVVVRAIGPTLSSFGLSGLSDLKLDLINQQTSATAASNEDWGGAAALATRFASLGAFALGAGSRDAAVQATLPINSGGYSVRITASGTGTSGLALAEVYDGDGADSTVRLGNVSTLGFAGTAENALTPGFVISGSAPKTLLIRAVGPGLTPLGVSGVLADPQLSIFPAGTSVAVASNNDWGGTAALKTAFGSAGAFALPDSSRDAAVVATLLPGGYTVVTSGAGNTTGTLLVEVYDLDP